MFLHLGTELPSGAYYTEVVCKYRLPCRFSTECEPIGGIGPRPETLGELPVTIRVCTAIYGWLAFHEAKRMNIVKSQASRLGRQGAMFWNTLVSQDSVLRDVIARSWP